MANPRKPHNLKVVAGTARADRLEPVGVDLPLVDGVPDAPDWLPNGHAVKEWQRLAPILVANKLLTEASLSTLGMLCALHGKIAQLYAAGEAPTGHMMAQYRGIANDFGLTPVAQGKVKSSGEKEKGTGSPAMASGDRDYVAIAKEYARQAVADRKGRKFGKWVRLAAKRFQDDLKRAKSKNPPFRFDEWHANDACDFIEKLPHVEGVWETPEIVLHPSHVFFVVQLFGFRNLDGSRRFTSALFAVARKNAKALALDTPVPTPNGWSTMGELSPGDVVFGADGKPCRVVAVSPVYEDHDCYRVGFSNGESVIADAGHRWLTTARVDRPGRRKEGNAATRTRVRTTREIAETLRYGSRLDTNHSVSMPSPLGGPDLELPVAPYTLGAWLGDGHSACARITCVPEDAEILDGIRADGWPVREKYSTGSKASTFVLSDGDRRRAARVQSLAAKLRQLGVLGNKHVPASYLRASLSQRLALLQGLMDTDGTVSKNGRVISYSGTSERLVLASPNCSRAWASNIHGGVSRWCATAGQYRERDTSCSSWPSAMNSRCSACGASLIECFLGRSAASRRDRARCRSLRRRRCHPCR